MQPLFEVTVERPWHWGVAILGDPGAEVPDRASDQVVVVGTDVIAIGVRHASDVDAESSEGPRPWATAAFHVRSLEPGEVLEQGEVSDRTVLCDTIIATVDATVALGDEEGMVIIPAPGLRTRVVVPTEGIDPAGLIRVWVDLTAADVSTWAGS